MNDKDKEAFEKWWDKERGGLPLNEDHIPVTERQLYKWESEAWQAACEYKQEEYSNIMEAMTRTSQYNFKLQAELLGYKEAASSEAAFVNELQAENAKLRKCVEFYANKAHWGIAKPSDSVSIDPCDHYDPYATETSISNANIGGKRARQVLKELED